MCRRRSNRRTRGAEWGELLRHPPVRNFEERVAVVGNAKQRALNPDSGDTDD